MVNSRMIDKLKIDIKEIENKLRKYIQSKQESFNKEENKKYQNEDIMGKYELQIEVLENTLENIQSAIENLEDYEI